MSFRLLACSVVIFGLCLQAQTAGPPSEAQRNAAFAAHRGDFDYLLGDWEFTSESKQYGHFSGRWSAVRLEIGVILDEYRVLSDDGSTIYVTSTVRSYNSAADRWELIGMDQGQGLLDFGTAHRVGDEMHIEQRFGVAESKSILMRVRYYNIQPDRFSWRADRSNDDGKTWTADFQRIEARRIGPARSLGALTPAPQSGR